MTVYTKFLTPPEAPPFLYNKTIAHPAILSLNAENQRDGRAYRVG